MPSENPLWRKLEKPGLNGVGLSVSVLVYAFWARLEMSGRF